MAGVWIRVTVRVGVRVRVHLGEDTLGAECSRRGLGRVRVRVRAKG